MGGELVCLAMSKKKSRVAQTRARLLREQAKPRPVESVELPSHEAVAAYQEAMAWAQANPEAADELTGFSESDWAGPMAGLAFPEVHNFPEAERRDVAWKFRAYHILSGFKYTLDWPRPVAEMSPAEIIAQLQADGAAGKITLAR